MGSVTRGLQRGRLLGELRRGLGLAPLGLGVGLGGEPLVQRLGIGDDPFVLTLGLQPEPLRVGVGLGGERLRLRLRAAGELVGFLVGLSEQLVGLVTGFVDRRIGRALGEHERSPQPLRGLLLGHPRHTRPVGQLGLNPFLDLGLGLRTRLLFGVADRLGSPARFGFKSVTRAASCSSRSST